MIVRYSAQALSDIEAIRNYLHDLSPQGGVSVLRAIYAGVQLVVEQPFVGQQTNDPGIRVKIVRRYRYKIFYSVVADREVVEILHVRHTSRRSWVAEAR